MVKDSANKMKMPLLVQELVVVSANSAVTSTESVQKCQAKPVAITAVSNTSAIPSGVPHNRVVALPPHNTRINMENGSRLAEALAGNIPYTYATSSVAMSPSIPASYATVSYGNSNHVNNRPPNVSTPSASSNHKYYRYQVTPRQNYQLPFVLQDHNYGAPPPTTPPHSPPSIPHVAVTPSQTNSYKTQHVSSSINPRTIPSSTKFQPHRKESVIESTSSVNPVPPVVVTSSGSIHTAPLPPSHFMASMPAHQQQFMPQPKTSLFSPPHSMHSPSRHDSSLHNTSIDTDEESRFSDRSSVSPSGEETETAPEGEGDEMLQPDDSITRCICDLTHDDGYMIQCDGCYVWQHVDCMEIDRDNIPEVYLCEACNPRQINRSKAKSLQIKRMQDIRNHLARMSSSDSDENPPAPVKSRLNPNKSHERKVRKKKTKVARDAKIPRKVQPSRKRSTSGPNGSLSLHPGLSSSIVESKEKMQKLRRRSSVHLHEVPEEVGQIITKEKVLLWAEDYEVAVTNHYSAELRARVQSARIPNVQTKLSDATDGAIMGHRCKVIPSSSPSSEYHESTVLVSTMKIKTGTPILEYQGKYLLESQWTSVQMASNFEYLPFVLKYNMPKEGLSIYVDARTYGNDARFARRASDFNAEVKHVLKRGSVHLYIVACKDLDEGEEIVLSLDSAICSPLYQPPKKAPVIPTPIPEETCSPCNEVSPTLVEEVPPSRKNGICQSKKSGKKSSLTINLPPAQNRVTRRSSETLEELVSLPSSPVKQRRLSGVAKSPVKSPVKSPTKPTKTEESSVNVGSPTYEKSKTNADDVKEGSKPLSREDRKLAAYIKAFERMEKTEKRKESKKRKSGDKFGNDTQSSQEEEDEGGSADDRARSDHRTKRRGGLSKHDRHESLPNGSESSEKLLDTSLSAPCSNMGPFRFPKTKKTLMNDWLNETVDPVLPTSASPGFEASGVPSCYMRCKSIQSRRLSGTASSNVGSPQPPGSNEVTGTSAKKRWLRQAIIDETEPVNFSFCSSPNSRPDSPNGSGDYTTPLKKRRLARESMSSEHSNTDEDKLNGEEVVQRLKSGEEMPFDIECKQEKDDSIIKHKVKKEPEEQNDPKAELREKSPKKHSSRSSSKSPFKTKQFGSRKRKVNRKAKIKIESDEVQVKSEPIEENGLDSHLESPEKTEVPTSSPTLDVNDNKNTLKTENMEIKPPMPSSDSETQQHPIAEDSIQEKSDLNAETKTDAPPPAPIKKKLSILEYRKRKSISSEREPRETFPKENGDTKLPPVDILSPSFVFDSKPPPPITESLEKPAVITSNGKDTEDVPKNYKPLSPLGLSNLSMTPPSPSSPTSEPLPDYNIESTSLKPSDIKWNAEPTLLEQQRENLTARLRREFGLCVNSKPKTSSDPLTRTSPFHGKSSSVIPPLDGEPSTTPPHSTVWDASIESELQRPPSPFQIAQESSSPVMGIRPKPRSYSPRMDPRTKDFTLSDHSKL